MKSDKLDNMAKIYYLASYQRKDERGIPCNSQAAKTKIDYIISILVELGYTVEIFSIALVSGRKTQKSKRYKMAEGVFVRYITSLGKKNKLITVMDVFLMHIRTLIFLLGIPRRSTVIVYHSLNYMVEVILSKVLKRHIIILEMEEIYADVTGKRTKNREIAFAKKVDAFIFPTRKIEKLVNTKKKPYVILHGVYQTKKRHKMFFKDNKTHIVYAGSLDPRKGAVAAIRSSLFLNGDYVLHLLGNGKKTDMDRMKQEINASEKMGTAKVIYEGVYEGEKFDQFVQSCDIGLCTQRVDASFTDTSFPSKVLMYLCNYLRVVCVPIETVTESNISDLVTFTLGDGPKAIAESIIMCKNEHKENTEMVLGELNGKFKDEINELIITVKLRDEK